MYSTHSFCVPYFWLHIKVLVPLLHVALKSAKICNLGKYSIWKDRIAVGFTPPNLETLNPFVKISRNVDLILFGGNNRNICNCTIFSFIKYFCHTIPGYCKIIQFSKRERGRRIPYLEDSMATLARA